jgi:hypothetical protein
MNPTCSSDARGSLGFRSCQGLLLAPRRSSVIVPGLEAKGGKAQRGSQSCSGGGVWSARYRKLFPGKKVVQKKALRTLRKVLTLPC